VVEGEIALDPVEMVRLANTFGSDNGTGMDKWKRNKAGVDGKPTNTIANGIPTAYSNGTTAAATFTTGFLDRGAGDGAEILPKSNFWIGWNFLLLAVDIEKNLLADWNIKCGNDVGFHWSECHWWNEVGTFRKVKNIVFFDN